MYLTGGISSQKGISFYGSGDGVNLGAYAYRTPKGNLKVVTGDSKEIRERFLEEKKIGKKESNNSDVWLLLLAAIVLVVLVAVFDGAAFHIAGMVVFVILAYFPVLVFHMIGKDEYENAEDFPQMRRNHGAEHTLVAYYRKNKNKPDATWSVEDLSKYSYLDPECGTAWSAALFVFAIVLGVSIALIPVWGLAKAAKVVGIGLLILLVNGMFNPWNPFRFVQKGEVAKPTEYELETALAAYCALEAAVDEADSAKASADEANSDEA